MPHPRRGRRQHIRQRVCVSIGFRFSEYISSAFNDTEGGYREVRKINLIPELADSSAGIIARTAKYSEKRILIHTLIGVKVITNKKNTWSLPHPPRYKVSVLSLCKHNS